MYASETIQNCKNPTGHIDTLTTHFLEIISRFFKINPSFCTDVTQRTLHFWKANPKAMRKRALCKTKHQAPVVQRPHNFIRWIRHYSGFKIYFTLNVVQGFRTLPNLAVVRVFIFAYTRGNTEIFAQIETVG